MIFNIAILTVGFSGLIAQMLFLREFLIIFWGNELSIGIIFANWLVLEAFGCFFLGKEAEKIKNKILVFVVFTCLFSIFLPISIYIIRILRNILGVSIGEGLGFLPILYSSFFVLLPTSVTHGALFTYSCKIYSLFSVGKAASIGKVYVYETAGTIMGGIIWTYLFIPYFNAFYVALLISMLNFFVCVLLLIKSSEPSRFYSKAILSIPCLFLFLCGYLVFGKGVDKLHRSSIVTQWRDQKVVHYQNSIYGNICVIERGGQYTFFTDGIPHITTPVPDIVFVEEFVHLPLLLHPEPKRVLVLSGGAGGVINEVLKHPSIKLIEYVELDPLLIRLIRKFPTSLTENELNDPRVKTRYIDGRLFLKMTKDKYDLIWVGLQEPSNLQVNRFFTREFFSLVKKRLNQRGILVIGLPGSLTYLNDELRDLNGCILNTLKKVFPYARVIPGDGTNLFLASDSKEILIEKEKLINKLDERNFKTDAITSWHIDYRLHPRWVDWFLEFLKGSSQKINHDSKPIGMFYSISHWNALFTPFLRGFFRWVEKVATLKTFLILFVIFVIFFFLYLRKNKKVINLSIPFCIFTTGFSGMIFDLALIYAFQAIYGYVFSWIGLLVTAFMAGAAFGAMGVTSALPRIENNVKSFIKIEGIIIFFIFLLLSIFLSFQPYLDNPKIISLRIVFLPLSFISGLLIGAQFPLANKIYLKRSENLSRTAGLLYSSDLLGGWLGGVIGGVVLLPILGLIETCIVVVLLKLSSLIMILGALRRGLCRL